MVVQQLRLHTANSGVTSWIYDQETKISHAMWQCQKKKKKDLPILPLISISQILLGGHFMIMLNNLCKWKWQPTPVFLPGKFHGQRSLVGYSPWDGKESSTTEQLARVSLLNFYFEINVDIQKNCKISTEHS